MPYVLPLYVTVPSSSISNPAPVTMTLAFPSFPTEPSNTVSLKDSGTATRIMAKDSQMKARTAPSPAPKTVSPGSSMISMCPATKHITDSKDTAVRIAAANWSALCLIAVLTIRSTTARTDAPEQARM